jgi:cell division protein FtsQ
MSRVKPLRPRALPARGRAIEAPNLPDRPGRWKLLLRRRRSLLRPLALLAVLAMLSIGLVGAVQGLGTGTNRNEKFGSVSGRAGLTVREVIVEGRQKTPESLLRAAIGAAPGDAILTLRLADMRTRIETINWVQSAIIERRLPGTLLVRITERSPFAVWQNDGNFRLIDRAGGVVADSDVSAFAGQLPLVVGLGAPAAAAALIDTLAGEPTLQTRVAAAVRIGERRWNLRMTNGTDVLLPEGAEAVALAKLAELQASQQLLDRPIAVIDMRLPDRLVLRPATEKPASPISQAKKT